MREDLGVLKMYVPEYGAFDALSEINDDWFTGIEEVLNCTHVKLNL